MDSNYLEIKQNNNYTLTATIEGITNMSGYTSIFTAKNTIDDSTALFSVTGQTTNTSATFNLLPIHTNQPQGYGHYDITLLKNSIIYTPIISTYQIINTVKY